jgi:hypothetical protein
MLKGDVAASKPATTPVRQPPNFSPILNKIQTERTPKTTEGNLSHSSLVPKRIHWWANTA